MLAKDKLDSIVNSIFDKLPEGFKQVKGDAEAAIKASISQAISKLDLVTQQEFETQIKVIDKLKNQINELEKKLNEIKTAK